MKRHLVKIVSILLGIAILFSLSIPVIAQNTNPNLKPSILNNVKRVKSDPNLPSEVVIGQHTKDISSISNNNSKIILKSLNVNFDNVSNVETIQNNSLNKIVNRVETKDARVDFDKDGNIVEYINYDDMSTVDMNKRDYKNDEPLQEVKYQLNSVDDLRSIIDNLTLLNDLQSYKFVDCSNNIIGVWTLTWNKDLGNGVLNSYDVATASIDAKDGSVIIFSRNTVTPNTDTPIVTKDEAIEFAQPIISKFNGKKIDASLTITKPNFYWEEGGPYERADFVRLAWKVTTDRSIIIMIDAQTGEILGGSQTQGNDYARALCVVPSFYKTAERVTLAHNGLNTLGYQQPSPGYDSVNHSITQTDVNYLFNDPKMYGLYLNCHGLEDQNGNYINAISDLPNWSIYASNLNSNWHFVFLDACWTSSNSAFASAMHCWGYTGRCFIGWNNSINTVTAYDFNTRFWPRVGTMTIHDDVVTSLNESRAAGYSDCDPGFWGDINYYGWSW